MGCDIHMYAEVRRKYNNPKFEPEWRLVGRVFKDSYYSKDQLSYLSVYENGDDYDSNSRYTEHPYQNRNYDLFAILANVRNGVGFAGVDTGDGFKCIAHPKGIPDDASKDYKQLVKNYGEGGHSHSYLTLEEIDNFDWSQTTKHRGWVNVKQYKIYLKKGKPESWSGGVSGGSVVHISNEEMNKVINGSIDIEGHLYTQVEWQESYRYSVGKTFFDSIEEVRKLLKKPGVLDVRLVFFFDN